MDIAKIRLTFLLLSLTILILLGLTGYIFMYRDGLLNDLFEEKFDCGVSDADYKEFVSKYPKLEHKGQIIFDENCQSCHGFDDIVVGPALRDVTLHLDTSLIKKMIRNYSKLVESKHPYATDLFHKYDQVVMNRFEFEDSTLNVLVDYLVELGKQIPKDSIIKQASLIK